MNNLNSLLDYSQLDLRLKMKHALTYIRVLANSDERPATQAKDWQMRMARFAEQEGYKVEREYLEIEKAGFSPQLEERIQLNRVIARAKWLNAPIITINLDSLHHDASVLEYLISHQMQVIFIGEKDNFSPFQLCPFRSVLLHETSFKVIATRGNPKLGTARKNATAALKSKADAHAKLILPLIEEAKENGMTSYRKIAEFLTAKNIKTVRGGNWSAKQVSNIIARLDPDINKFLDDAGRLTQLPKNKIMRRKLLVFLSERFTKNTQYSEGEVNGLLQKNHSFNDHALLRRELIEAKLLARTANGEAYWLVKQNGDNS